MSSYCSIPSVRILLHIQRPHTATYAACRDAAEVQSVMVLDGDVVPGERARYDTKLR